METIIEYLKETYHPIGLIVYGSFANGTHQENSDFDALLVTEDGPQGHDHSYVLGTELDVFLYPKATFMRDYDIEDFIQVWDGLIVLDSSGLLAALKERANVYIQQYAPKSRQENEHNVAWCQKMLSRTQRADTEGFYRLHWLLKDSLEIYFDVRGQYFFGPKKALRQMEETDPEAARLYDLALRNPSLETVGRWVACLRERLR